MPKPRKNYFQNKRKFYGPRSNHWIKSVDVQVISSSGKNLGVLPIREAIETAKREGLDLVEISSKVTPPICKIMSIGKYKYDLQKKEAAYRKILVIAEDDGGIRPKTLEELFQGVRQIHFKSYLYYLYFSIGRLAYLQANVLAAYIFLAPAIVAGVMTLGVMQQIIRAFGRVEGSLQYLFRAWPTIIELASVYKRLREFENQIEINIQQENLKNPIE